jgi:hypothetical protein
MTASTVLDSIWALFHQEKGVDAIIAQAMATMLEFVIVDHTHKRMEERRTHIAGIVIYIEDLQDIIHVSEVNKKASNSVKVVE